MVAKNILFFESDGTSKKSKKSKKTSDGEAAPSGDKKKKKKDKKKKKVISFHSIEMHCSKCQCFYVYMFCSFQKSSGND